MNGKLDRARQSQRALMGVRELVISGEIGAGSRLSEVALAERLGISRTPLRAALARLAEEGLVEAIPSGGYAVRSFAREDVVGGHRRGPVLGRGHEGRLRQAVADFDGHGTGLREE